MTDVEIARDAASCIPGSRHPAPRQMAWRATFPLPEGLVALEIPERLSAESFEDLEAWLQVMLRRARRSVGEKTASVPGAPSPE